MTTMVNGNQSSFNFESDSLDLLTILEICLEFLVTIIGDILYLTIYMSLRKIWGRPNEEKYCQQVYFCLMFNNGIIIILVSFNPAFESVLWTFSLGFSKVYLIINNLCSPLHLYECDLCFHTENLTNQSILFCQWLKWRLLVPSDWDIQCYILFNTYHHPNCIWETISLC